jgi:hypothetical protein
MSLASLAENCLGTNSHKSGRRQKNGAGAPIARVYAMYTGGNILENIAAAVLPVSGAAAATSAGDTQPAATFGPSQLSASTPAYSPDNLIFATSRAVSAIIGGLSASSMDMAALGNLGSDLVTSERLLATMPPNLGTQVDAVA